MLKPVPMAKVAVVGPKTQLGPAIETLHDLNLLHIEDYAPGEDGFELGSPLPQGAAVSERLLRLRGTLKGANIPPPAALQRFAPENLAGLQDKLAEVERELTHLVEKRAGLLDQGKRLEEEAAVLSRIRNFPLPLELVSGYRSLATATGFLPPEASHDGLRGVHADAEVLASEEDEGTFVFVAAPRAADRALQGALSKARVQLLEIPPARGTAAHRLAQLGAERDRLAAEAAQLEGKISAIRERHAGAFYALDEVLSIQADRTAAPVRFRTTRNAFMVEGWVPRAELARLKSALAGSTHGRVFVTELPLAITQPWKTRRHHEEVHEGHDLAHTDTPPVRLHNPRAAGAYELLTDTYSRPRYSEIDPTLFFYIGFPLFYGIMLGDIAYGVLLILLVFTGVFTRLFDFFGFQSKAHLNRILLHSAVMSILFGVLYSEFFGLELFGKHGVVSHFSASWGDFHYPLARFENVQLLLLMSLAIATIHMFIGLVVGLRNASVEHGWAHAIKHRGSWLCILLAAGLGGAGAVPGILNLSSLTIPNPAPLFYAAIALLLAGVVLLVAGEGATGLFELPTILSNLLSYTRLVAIGLSSAGIALAGNEVAKLALSGGGALGIAAAVLILLFFHTLNLVLGIIGPALHSLRLHYVEFFTKFYEGGGEPFAPFGAQRKYTVKEAKHA